MKTTYLGHREVNDGYNGDRYTQYLVYDPQTMLTLAVAPYGHFRSELPPCVSAQESLWMLKNHPVSKSIGRLNNEKVNP